MLKALGFHTISKILVIFAGYILHFCLGNVLSVEEYGVIGTVIAFCNFYYMFLTNGVRQGISKLLSANIYDNKTVVKKGMTVQTIFSLALAGINLLLAPILAEAFGDSAFEKYIMMISVLIPLTAIYFAFTGGLNGSKLFFAEALVVSIYPMLRLSAIPLSMISEDNKVIMVILGFSLASLISAIIAGSFLLASKKLNNNDGSKESIGTKKLLNVSFEFIIFFAAITMVLNMDTFFLQYVCKDTGLTGYYTGVHTFSLVPYYLISAFYLVILPYVAENYVKGDIEKIKGIIAKNFNIIFAIVLPITALIAVTAPELLASFYDKDYYVAGNALTILSVGTFLLSSFAVLNVVLSGMNSKKISKIMSVLIVIVDIVLLNILIPIKGIEGAALATTISAFLGCIIATIYLVKKLGNPFDMKAILKSIVLVAIFVIVTRILFNIFEFDNLLKLVLIYLVLGISYLACMLVFKVVDIKQLISSKK